MVFINSGTTTTQLIRYSRRNRHHRDHQQPDRRPGLRAGFEIVLVSFFHPRRMRIAGRFAIENISSLYADKAFIGVGITLKHGFTVPADAEGSWCVS
jgi:DeoR/GlpR family transcriptional regulator of sugar metabolism